jgi:putative nucleotidyltransferase with HDIG domain
MNKLIPLEQLTLGMYVVGMDKPWIETPFLRNSFRISKPAQIESMRSCGVKFVEVEEDSVPVLPSAGEVEAPASADPQTYSEELEVAKEVYRDAKHIVSLAMQDVRMGREVRMDVIDQVVSRMTESVLRNPDAIASLSRLKSFDEYTFFHSVNTCVLAVALGRRLRLERDHLQLLGTGALLHDIGKMAIPAEILNKAGKLSTCEYEIIKQHAMRGAEILSTTTGLREQAILPALEHHERVDGTGYPHRKSHEQLSMFGLISAVVDVYDAVTSDRVYHKAMVPHKALQFLYVLGQRGHLDLRMVQHFIQCVGVYPVGSVVSLNTGEIAIVRQVHQEAEVRPSVLLVRDGCGVSIDPPRELDLAREDPTALSITEVLDPKTLGIDPAQWLGHQEEHA